MGVGAECTLSLHGEFHTGLHRILDFQHTHCVTHCVIRFTARFTSVRVSQQREMTCETQTDMHTTSTFHSSA